MKSVFLGAATAFAMALPAMATTISFDFESGQPAEFTGTGFVAPVQGLAGSNGFAGSFWWNKGLRGQATTVTLDGLAAHDTVTLSFGLALIDSWDGIRA